ncbi:MAG: class I SAM-dependent methyltransferase [Chloroflexota bacterium]
MRSVLRRLHFALSYLSAPPWDTGVSPPELLDFIAQHPPGRALDLGCGTGTNALTLARAGWSATGVDFVPRAIRAARRKAKSANLHAEFLVADVTRLPPFPAPFDLVLDIGCFHSLGERKADYLAQLEGLLAPGGTWLAYGFLAPAPPLTGRFDGAQHKPGVAEADLERIPASLSLLWRQDGTERGMRPSAWFLYQKT